MQDTTRPISPGSEQKGFPIAKPPGYKESSVEMSDTFAASVPPPRGGKSPRGVETGKESAKLEEADGEREGWESATKKIDGMGFKEGALLHLPSEDLVMEEGGKGETSKVKSIGGLGDEGANNGKKWDLGVDNIDGGGDKWGKGENMWVLGIDNAALVGSERGEKGGKKRDRVVDGGGGGESGHGEEEREKKMDGNQKTSPGASKKLLNNGEKKNPEASGKSAGESEEDDVYALVDEVEGALEGASKGDCGMLNRLVTALRTLLPIVLFMFDELKMLRGKVKGLIVDNRVLQKEASQAKQELEIRKLHDDETAKDNDALDKPRPEVNPGKQCANCQLRAANPERDDVVEVEDVLNKEICKLRHHMKELHRVNHSWERYSEKQAIKHRIELKKYEAQLAAANQRRSDLEHRLDSKLKECDQTLLHANTMQKQQKAAAEQYRKDRDNLREKYDETKAELRAAMKDGHEKAAEIRRLNDVMERQATGRVKTAPIVHNHYSPQRAQTNTSTRTKRESQNPEQCELHFFPPNMPNKYVNMERKPEKLSNGEGRQKIPSKEKVGYHGDKSPSEMTSKELKDQVILFREQLDAYRGDFLQERADREKAVGQVDSLKKDLKEARKRLRDIQEQRAEHEYMNYPHCNEVRRQRYLDFGI